MTPICVGASGLLLACSSGSVWYEVTVLPSQVAKAGLRSDSCEWISDGLAGSTAS